VIDVHAKLTERFPELFPEGAALDADGPLVPVEHHVDLARFLRDECGYVQYVTVVASHWPGKDGDAWEVATVLRTVGPGTTTFQWRVRLEGEPHIPTLYPLFAGADWQEREQFDMVGVIFDDHPDLRRLLLPEDWEGYPLRKDYPIDKPHPPWR